MIKPLILNSTDNVGGAARAAYRLHQALRGIGVDSEMLVQIKFSNDDSVAGAQSSTTKRLAYLAYELDQFPLKSYRDRREGFFSPQWIPQRIVSNVNRYAPDVINLHWINNGFVRIEALKRFKAPIVWTMHDMWPFTGGCHYSTGCERYTEACGCCPLLRSENENDLSRHVWKRKSNSWENLDITVVALSNWLAECARRSSLFAHLPIKVIPNCIDTSIWKPVERDFAREQLGLPKDKKIAGFAALRATSDRRKGFHLLMPAMELLRGFNLDGKLELAVLGASDCVEIMELPIRTHALGEIHDDEQLTLFYSAIDVFVLPSIQDNLPNTIMESLSCATPCVAFEIGGLADMLDHGINGYLCRPFEAQDFAAGIAWVLEDEERQKFLSNNARQKVLSTYAPKVVANQYLDLFSQITN